MITIEESVLNDFVRRLSENDAIDDAIIAALRDRLAAGNLPTAESLSRLYFEMSGDKIA